jgi:hypothetical protein
MLPLSSEVGQRSGVVRTEPVIKLGPGQWALLGHGSLLSLRSLFQAYCRARGSQYNETFDQNRPRRCFSFRDRTLAVDPTSSGTSPTPSDIFVKTTTSSSFNLRGDFQTLVQVSQTLWKTVRGAASAQEVRA